MDVAALKERVDSGQLEAWKAWFGFNAPGGVRTPSDEINDILISRLLSLTMSINCTRGQSVRDLMLFPPPITEAEMQSKYDHAKACIAGCLSLARKS